MFYTNHTQLNNQEIVEMYQSFEDSMYNGIGLFEYFNTKSEEYIVEFLKSYIKNCEDLNEFYNDEECSEDPFKFSKEEEVEFT